MQERERKDFDRSVWKNVGWGGVWWEREKKTLPLLPLNTNRSLLLLWFSPL